ncbi:BrnT family toxin [Granulicella tundricola]|uniref:BrnT family toxin n=1 Tax=Granulicella tundricola TaxID=940615 RepID=UPI000324ABEC|nr:BrnT family toxin [Granulicella tundricola]
MRFTWDERKARRNVREHGLSFPLGQAAIESGLGIPVEEQFREGEWRTLVVAPVHGILLITIVVTLNYGEQDEDLIETGEYEQEPIDWQDEAAVIRIISVREASAAEQALYFESRPAFGR